MFLVPRREHAVRGGRHRLERRPGAERHRQLLICNEVNAKIFDALRAFRDEHRSQGPSRSRSAISLRCDLQRSCGGATGRLLQCWGCGEAARLSSGASVRPCLVPSALAAKPADFERPPRTGGAGVRAAAFNLVGLHWRGRAMPDAEMRVLARAAGGAGSTSVSTAGRVGPGMGRPRADGPVPARPMSSASRPSGSLCRTWLLPGACLAGSTAFRDAEVPVSGHERRR